MKCPRCQAENREGARFCREWGATFGAVCGAKVEAGSKFCDGCGTPLAAPGLAPSHFASPESYTPRHLAHRDDDVPRDGHALLAGAGGGRDAVVTPAAERTLCATGQSALSCKFPPALLPVAAPRLQPLQQQTQRRKGGLILGAVGSFLGANDVRE